MSDRVAVMDHGRVLQVGAPHEIYEKPASVFVANFVGVSNTVTGRIIAVDEGRCTVSTPDLPAVPAIYARAPLGARAGARVTLVLRPERLHLACDARPDVRMDGLDNAVPARVAKAIYNGSEMQYHLSLSESLLWQARVPNSRGDQKRFLPGESVYVRWKVDEGVILTE